MLDQVVQALSSQKFGMSSQHIQGHLKAHCNTKNGTLLASAPCWDSDVVNKMNYCWFSVLLGVFWDWKGNIYTHTHMSHHLYELCYGCTILYTRNTDPTKTFSLYQQHITRGINHKPINKKNPLINTDETNTSNFPLQDWDVSWQEMSAKWSTEWNAFTKINGRLIPESTVSQRCVRLQENIPVWDEILKHQDKEHPTTKRTPSSPVHLFKAVCCEVEALYFGVTCFEGTIKRAQRIKTTFSFKQFVYKYTRLSCSVIFSMLQVS